MFIDRYDLRYEKLTSLFGKCDMYCLRLFIYHYV